MFKRFGTPTAIRKFNGWATIFWLVMGVPSILWWKTSVLWVIVLSLWANVVGHFDGWISGRVEVRAENVQGRLTVTPDVDAQGPHYDVAGTVEVEDV